MPKVGTPPVDCCMVQLLQSGCCRHNLLGPGPVLLVPSQSQLHVIVGWRVLRLPGPLAMWSLSESSRRVGRWPMQHMQLRKLSHPQVVRSLQLLDSRFSRKGRCLHQCCGHVRCPQRQLRGHLELPHLVPKHASRHPECKARIWDVLLVPSRLVTCRSHHLGESVLCHQWACHLFRCFLESGPQHPQHPQHQALKSACHLVQSSFVTQRRVLQQTFLKSRSWSRLGPCQQCRLAKVWQPLEVYWKASARFQPFQGQFCSHMRGMRQAGKVFDAPPPTEL